MTTEQQQQDAEKAVCGKSPSTAGLGEQDATEDECIELAQALEQLRALKIVEAVAALPIGGATANMPTPFHAGYQLACEEIEHRLRTEIWEGCLKPKTSKFSGGEAVRCNAGLELRANRRERPWINDLPTFAR